MHRVLQVLTLAAVLAACLTATASASLTVSQAEAKFQAIMTSECGQAWNYTCSSSHRPSAFCFQAPGYWSCQGGIGETRFTDQSYWHTEYGGYVQSGVAHVTSRSKSRG